MLELVLPMLVFLIIGLIRVFIPPTSHEFQWMRNTAVLSPFPNPHRGEVFNPEVELSLLSLMPAYLQN